jgi:hypothetical protein
LGKDFRKAVAALGAPDDLVRRLNEVSSDLSSFWQQHREFLGKVRNAIAAHREHDALKYVEAVDSLAWMEVMKRAAELSAHLERLIAVLTEIGRLTGGPAAILRDVLQSNAGSIQSLIT